MNRQTPVSQSAQKRIERLSGRWARPATTETLQIEREVLSSYARLQGPARKRVDVLEEGKTKVQSVLVDGCDVELMEGTIVLEVNEGALISRLK